ncbi:MAG: prephenate dehydrogenase/arogenate dehydrogenase family protein [Candidatus Anstonellaceae archaeon]
MRIAIIGIGKMGSWLAKQLSFKHQLAVFDIDPRRASRIENAKVLASIDEIREFSPQLLINSVSLDKTIEVFEDVLIHTPPECIISDVASIKGELADFYKKCRRRFVSVHPMFGPTFANMEMLKHENAVIISESDKQGGAFFKDFFSSFGLRIFEYTFSEHDEMMAYSLTTPFVSSLVFTSCLDKTAVPGTTFLRHMEIAKKLLSEDDSLICEILFNPHSLKQLDKMTSKLEYLKHIIRARDTSEATKLLSLLRKNLEE